MSFLTRAASGGVVGGASSLSTAGAIPYVSSSGTLNQDTPGLHWDATNNRLGLGTVSPDFPLTVKSSANNAYIANFRTTDSNNTSFRFGINASNADRLNNYALIEAGDGTSASTLTMWPSGKITLNTLGSVGIGPSNTSPTGTLHV